MTTPNPPPDPLNDPATEEELLAAAELRDALEDPALANVDADLLRALALAHSPRPLEAEEHRVIVQRALVTARPRGEAIPMAPRPRALVTAHAGHGEPAPRRGIVVRFAFGATVAGLAAAAAFVLSVRSQEAPVGVPPAAEVQKLARARSTQPLFHEPFARQGGESARIDRIALARASDLRDNRFRRWGVR